MLGAIIGDIVGSKYEHYNVENENFKFFENNNFFTDDTVCTVAVANAVMNHGTYQKELREWGNRHFDSGHSFFFYTWLLMDEPRPYNSFGSGSAMRVSPTAWAYDTLDEVKREARKSAEITHNHPEGIKGAVATAHIIFFLRNNRKNREWKKEMEEIALNYYPDFKERKFIRGEYDSNCDGTVPLCIKLMMQSSSFEDAVRKAVVWGGDSDTIGAIVGSMAEAFYGIPADMRKTAQTYLTEDMNRVVDKFYQKYM